MKDRITKIPRTFYQPNSLPYLAVFLTICLNLWTTINSLNSMDRTYLVGVITLKNIILTLVLFLCAIKIKNYSYNWTWFIFGFVLFLLFQNYYLYKFIYQINESAIFKLRIVNYTIIAILIPTNLLTIKRVIDQRNYQKLIK